MTGKTHLIGGIAASLAVSYGIGESPFIITTAGIVGALLPDICHSGSRIGRQFPFLSKLINLLFGHRTVTHSLLFLVLISLITDQIFSDDLIKYGLLAGMISHYLLDMATHNGIRLFFPLPIVIRFPITVKTGGRIEKFFLSILTLVCWYYIFKYIAWFYL
ncbi:metal-dependent hydrolase [Salinicoccus siamensis]|uniref:Metal-dependent hydrolase n=1 Tax=Salinicoccus siamensis TaxID=381830 RepID=A0ABV5Z072_9STAP